MFLRLVKVAAGIVPGLGKMTSVFLVENYSSIEDAFLCPVFSRPPAVIRRRCSSAALVMFRLRGFFVYMLSSLLHLSF